MQEQLDEEIKKLAVMQEAARRAGSEQWFTTRSRLVFSQEIILRRRQVAQRLTFPAAPMVNQQTACAL